MTSLRDVFSGLTSVSSSVPEIFSFSGGGFGGRRGDSVELLPFSEVLPPVKDNQVSAPSSADSVESVHQGADDYADYSNTSAYDDYLAMLQKGADIGLFSTAQDVVNEAQKDRLFQSLEAEKERSWYEDLANSSYQRQVKDLQAAGLNPILGFANLGTGSATAHSAVPSGRASGLTAVAPNLADYLNAGSNIISSASSIIKAFSGLIKPITNFIGFGR